MKMNRIIQRSIVSLLIGLTQAHASASVMSSAPDVIPTAKRICRAHVPTLEAKPEIIERLTTRIYGVFKGIYQSNLDRIDQTRLIAAESFVSQLLGREADQYHMVQAVIAFGNVDLKRCTPHFKDLVKEFTQGISPDLIPLVICAFGKTDSQDLDDLARATTLLSNGMNADERATNLVNLADLPLQHFTPAFDRVVERLTNGMNRSAKVDVICAYGIVQPQHLEDVATMAECLSAEMNLADKLSVVCAANSIPPSECKVFKEVFDFLSIGLSLPKKAECFREFAHVYDLCAKFWKDHNLELIRSATWFTFLRKKSKNNKQMFWKKWAERENSDSVISEIERWVARYGL